MKKFDTDNYERYKKDVLTSQPKQKPYNEYTRDELIIKFMPLVENLARKFPTAQTSSGILTLEDFIGFGHVGLIKSVDKIDYKTLNQSEDQEKTIKSFFSKRIKGAIRRAIDRYKGDIRIPEHKLNEIRKDAGKDKKLLSILFNSMFLSIDHKPTDESESMINQVMDESQPYKIDELNDLLLDMFAEHLTYKEAEVLIMSYGLVGPKLTAAQIADKLKINVSTAHVRVSQIKKDAVNKLINNVNHSQVIDFL
jgi:RNA polymerase sigma factor (sigma-70 family)